MTEQLRETCFLAIRTCLLLALEIYIVLSQAALISVSGGEILLLAFFVGAMAGKELVKSRNARWFLAGAAAVLCLMMVKALERNLSCLEYSLAMRSFP